jgi:hypothetical protein
VFDRRLFAWLFALAFVLGSVTTSSAYERDLVNLSELGVDQLSAINNCHGHGEGRKQRSLDRCCNVGCVAVSAITQTLGNTILVKKALPTPAGNAEFAGRSGDVETPPPRYG